MVPLACQIVTPDPIAADTSVLSRLPAVARFDDAVDEWWECLRGNPIADRVFYTATNVAEFSGLWHALGTIGSLQGTAGRARAARLSSALAAESVLVNGVLKRAFRRTRPDADPAVRPLRMRHPLTSSFPSGHASSAFLAAGLLTDDRRLKPLAYALAAVVATSRIHVRIHHASDVVAGAALGAALAAVVRRVRPLG